MSKEEEDVGYSWEAGYAESLNIRGTLQEDKNGSLNVVGIDANARRRRNVDGRPGNVRLGIMRHVYLVLDCSDSMTEKDLLPSRFSCLLKVVNRFLDKFFEHNPISQLGFIVTKDKRARKITELTGNIHKHREALETLNDTMCIGEPSLQNSLELALKTLKDLPTHTSREIVVIMGSLSTCDPTNIYTTFEQLRRHKIRCSVIGLVAEVFVCSELCKETGGEYSVILDECHLETLLFAQTTPPISPVIVNARHHADDAARQPTSSGYFCPQCDAKYCTIPVQCRLCGLILVSATQLARSYQHLAPLAAFEDIDIFDERFPTTCRLCSGCNRSLDSKSYRCKQCDHVFCIDCDLFLHESLQICPKCAK